MNSLWPRDIIWWHKSGSILAQVMTWCLMAPGHYLNQCWTSQTRTTRTPAFWEYPPPPHDYPHRIESCWIPQVKTRSNDLEDIGWGQRSSHATQLLMLVIICTKYGKTPSGNVDATERTRFSRPRPNDLEDIGQGQRSLYATHHLILVLICAKYGKNPLRTVKKFQGQGRKFLKICQKILFPDSEKK